MSPPRCTIRQRVCIAGILERKSMQLLYRIPEWESAIQIVTML